MKTKYTTVKSTFPRIYKYQKNNYDYFLVDSRSKFWCLKTRKNFTTKQQAVDWARDLENQIKEKGDRVSENVVYSNPEIEKLIDRLQSRGKTIQDAVNFYFQSLDLELKQSLVPSIQELSEKWYTERRDNTLSPISNRTKIELNSYRKFIHHYWGQLRPSQVTKKDIYSVLTKTSGNNNTKLHRYKKVRQFFNWCIENKYVLSNPTDGIEIEVDEFEVKIWTPDQISQLLTIVEEKYPSLLGYYVLCIYAGLRPTEAQRVEWMDLCFETKEIHINKLGKTGSRRFVLATTPNGETDTVWTWLKHFREIQPKGSPLNPLQNHAGLQIKVRRSVPFPWVQDGLRHSFGTYYYNLIQDLERVIYVMGNSKDICKKHYIRAVKKVDSDGFWGLCPSEKSQNSVRTLSEENSIPTTDKVVSRLL